MKHAVESFEHVIARQITIDDGQGDCNVKVMGVLSGTLYFSAAANSIDLGYLPKGVTLIETVVTVEVVFNAGVSNIIVMGTAAGDDTYIAAAGINEAAATRQIVSHNRLGITAKTKVVATYTPGDANANSGVAHFEVRFEAPRGQVK